MTSVPKPFKFLKTHYEALTHHFNQLKESPYKVSPYSIQVTFSDFLSALSMIFGEKGERKSLYYLLKGTAGDGDFTSWGHEYVSNLASDISK